MLKILWTESSGMERIQNTCLLGRLEITSLHAKDQTSMCHSVLLSHPYTHLSGSYSFTCLPHFLENKGFTIRTQHLEYRVWAGFDAVMTLFFTSTQWPRSLESLGSFHLVWLYLVFWVYFSTFYLPFDEKTRVGTEGHGGFHVATPSVLRHDL